MNATLRRALVASCFGIRAGIAIWAFGDSLVPDTAEYAAGHAWWSSPLCAGFGYAGGLAGVRVFGLLGAMGLGWMLGNLPASRIAAVGILPPGWYAMQASSDAAGAALAGWSELKWGRIPFVFLVHMQAALTCGFARVAIPYLGNLSFLAAGAISCLGQWHFQMRYFLPGVTLWAVRKGVQGDSLRYRAARSWEKLLRV